MTYQALNNAYLTQPSNSPYGKFYRVDLVRVDPSDYYVVKNWGADNPLGRRDTSQRGQYAVELFRNIGAARAAYSKAISNKTNSGYHLPNVEDDLPITAAIRSRVGQTGAHVAAAAPKTTTNVLSLSPIAALGVRAMQEASAGNVTKALELRAEMATHVEAARVDLAQGEAMLDTLVAHLTKLL